MSRSYTGIEKAEAKRNHNNRKAQDSFQWDQIQAQFMSETPKTNTIKIRKVA